MTVKHSSCWPFAHESNTKGPRMEESIDVLAEVC
jgi:hypothetical protein